MKINIKIDEILLKQKDQVKKLEDVINSQKILNDEFEHMTNKVTKFNETWSRKKLSF